LAFTSVDANYFASNECLSQAHLVCNDGLADLAPHIDGLQRVRLMFGVEAPRDVELRRPNLGESSEHFESRLMRESQRQSRVPQAGRQCGQSRL
jgi:hypothetical protein